MVITKEEIIKRVINEIEEGLTHYNQAVHNWEKEVLDVDLENKTITIKFNFHIEEEDDYIGLSGN